MKKRTQHTTFEGPSLVPLADMLTNTVGIMLFILIFTVINATNIKIDRVFPVVTPTAKQPRIVLCLDDHLYFLDHEGFKSEVFTKYGEPNSSSTKLERWASRVNGLRMERDGFRIRGAIEYSQTISGVPHKAKLYYRALPNSGEDAQQIGGTGSKYQATLRSVSAKDYYIYFYLYSNSPNVFIKAKTLAEQAGFETGWYPIGNQETMTQVIWVGDGSVEPMKLEVITNKNL